MGRLVVAGAGVLGLLSALEAVWVGHTVDLVEPDDATAISWSGARIVRDDEPGDGRNTAPWRALMARSGYGAPDPRPVLHWHAGTCTPEYSAFVVDTARLRAELRTLLRAQPGARFHVDRAVALELDGHGLRLAGGRRLVGDRVLVAVGTQVQALLPNAPVSHAHQVYATVEPEAVLAATIEHDGASGVWATPAVGSQPAKISASDLCFTSHAEARHALSEPHRHRDLLDRARGLGLAPGSVSEWRSEVYLESKAPLFLHQGGAVIQLACSGGGFKRAARLAREITTSIDHQKGPL